MRRLHNRGGHQFFCRIHLKWRSTGRFLDRIGVLKREIERTDTELASSEAKVGTLQETLSNLPEKLLIEETTGFPNYGADAMRDRLYELQLKEQDLLSKFNEESN